MARDAAMFPIDAPHRFVRHSVKSHGRETIAFGRRTEAQLDRMHLFAVFRNFVKRRTERRPGALTPAALYDRRMHTPTLTSTPPHQLKLAH